MFPFFDVLHETKQKNASKLWRVGSTDWKSSLNAVPCTDVCTCMAVWEP